MCAKERRRLTIPPSKAYGPKLFPSHNAKFLLKLFITYEIGSRGFGNLIPANSALVFDVELVEITAKRDEL